ncbi:undecaprenyl-diphosphate phosphatase [Arthrobacter sp. 24S4-2]|uniref:undecaprenyl-diphosphate phosphatase n=1 Tax=Arthrobacter sp. 24S4-2 TaxID=2575374 RepID=UPI0010C7A5F8|nr:undecaprenyl-diphosphate phosphatase [Arthrobacter sp. 24S4-2]QCO96461.1 undecaprenyl-diphosphate phosphatase [Arthrobacter sp. 24S4-2]
MINILQAAILGLIQGVTELFPISSLGHSVILPALFGWDLDQNNPSFLTFLIATHLATAIVLFVFFLKDWIEIFKGLGRSVRDRKISAGDTYAKLGWLLIAGTIPAGILGLVLEKPIRGLFASPLLAAGFLVVNGLVLFAAEALRRRRTTPALVSSRSAKPELGVATSAQDSSTPDSSMTASLENTDVADSRLAGLSWKQAFGIGSAQAAALLPGISRSGSSMVGGLLSGLSHEHAARFSFLLATPIIGAAAILKLPEVFNPAMAEERGSFLVGAVCAAAAAWLSTKFLLRFFETKSLTPFAVYSVIGGGVYFTALLLWG